MSEQKVFCCHPECPHYDCNLNQCYIGWNEVFSISGIKYIDTECLKYLDT